MKEQAVERRLNDLVQKAGGISVKIMPVVAGLPDRLVILPPGKMFLVETKAPSGRLRPIQKVWHRNAAAVGVPVAILKTIEEVENWVIDHAGVADELAILRDLRDTLRHDIDNRRLALEDPWAELVLDKIHQADKEIRRLH